MPPRPLPLKLCACTCIWLSQSACTVISPQPLFELVKAAGAVTSTAIAMGPSEASYLVYHGTQGINTVCIEYNPNSQSVDILPAIQNELKTYQIGSRIYEPGTRLGLCQIWLKYTASIEWDTPFLGSEYKAYLTTAMLTLQTEGGNVLASSGYDLGRNFQSGKWATTQSKIQPVIHALITGEKQVPSNKQTGATP